MARVGNVVGHGITPGGVTDLGAGDDDSHWNEQNAGDVIARVYRDELRRHDVVVPVDESYSDDGNYVESVELCNDADVDLAVSWHHDWYGAPEGFFVHWYPGAREANKVADKFYNAVKAAGYKTRPDWHKARDLYFVRETQDPAVLVELGQIGQYTKNELVELGKLLARVTVEHFGIKYKKEDGYEKDVAIIYHDVSDQDLAHQLGDEFIFWVDRAPNPSKDIRYAVLVGSAHHFEDTFPDSTKLLGRTRIGTGIAVKEALKDGLEVNLRTNADARKAPWADGYYVDR